MQVAHAHLTPVLAVLTAVNAVVVLAAAQAIPHLAHVGRNLGGCPVGPTVVGDDAPQMLDDTVLILHRALDPVVRVQVDRNATLVKAVTSA